MSVIDRLTDQDLEQSEMYMTQAIDTLEQIRRLCHIPDKVDAAIAKTITQLVDARLALHPPIPNVPMPPV
jgi:hypothetical protein